MYQYISAIVKSINGSQQWDNVDISLIPLNLLFQSYSRIVVILSNPFLSEAVAVDLATIQVQVEGLNITLLDFLTQNGNKTLTKLPNVPSLTPRFAKWNDATRAGYKITPISPNASVSSQLPLSEKDWLLLTRPNTSYSTFYDHCLVNVNGFFHLTDTDGTGIYVVDGNKTGYKSNHTEVGIYSFRDLGQLTFVPIKADMIFKEAANSVYADSAYVDIDVDTTGKSVMLVLGGYLHVLDSKTFVRVNNHTFKINFANYPLLDRFFDSKDYLDYSTLNLSGTTKNKDQIAISELYSDEAIKAYLTLSQSFFVLLDNASIFTNKIPLHKTPIPNMYIGYTEPLYPLVTELGRAVPYWPTKEDGQWSLACVDVLRKNPVYKTLDFTAAVSADNTNEPDEPVRIGQAHYLQIGSVFVI